MPAMDMLTDIRDRDDDIKGLELMKVVDGRVDCAENNAIDSLYVGYIGAQYWNSYSIPATVYTKNEVLFTNITTPGADLLIDKKWWIEYIIKVTIKDIPGTVNSPNTLISTDPAFMFRPYPLHQTTNCIQIVLNGRNIQSFPMESLNQRMEYWPQKMLKLSCGCCPHRKFNGQTLADCSIRKGNSPLGEMSEFTDQDFPNSTIIDVLDVSQTDPVIDADSNFERNAPFKAYKLHKTITGGLAPQTTPAITKGTAIAANDIAAVYYRYFYARYLFAQYIQNSTDYNGIVGIGDIMTAKNYFKNNNTTFQTLLSTDPALGIANPEVSFSSQTLVWLDVDFLSDKDVDMLKNAGYIAMDGTKPKEFWSGANCSTRGSFTMTVRIREPIIAEPLDYTSSADFGRTIWNLQNIELRYTFNNYMKNMLVFDQMKLQRDFEWYWAYEVIKGLYEGKAQNLISDDTVDIDFVEAPRLIFNVATPFQPPNRTFITAHKQFQRFESHLSVRMNAANIDRKDYISLEKASKITAISDVYPLQFHPNAVYVWVGERNLNRYSSPNRYYHIDSYAKITGLRITYGNTSNIMAQFDAHELFLMSLRNGLQDRSFLDWNAGPKSITTNTEYNGAKNMFGYGGNIPVLRPLYDPDGTTLSGLTTQMVNYDKLVTYNRYAGIGSVLKLIPGIDILTGDNTNPLVAGMATSAMTFKVEVDFLPLNINESIDYSLYVMFEYDGICTISKDSNHQCDLGMIAIDTWEQLKASPKMRTAREVYAYGSGLGGKALDWGRKVRNISSQLGILRRSLAGSGRAGSGGAINGHPNMAPKMSGGKLINPRDLNGGNFYTSY